jgi:hypothetical protein
MGKCNNKEREKDFSKIIVRQRKGAFFGKEVLHKCAKKSCQQERQNKG